MMSMRTIETPRSASENRNRLTARRGGQHLHSSPLEHAAEREDIAGVVIDQKRLSALQIFVGIAQPLQHALLVRRKIGDDAMEEKRGFVEKALRQLRPPSR